MPALQRFDGFAGLLVLANRRNGEIMITTLWEGEETMRGSEDASHWFRAFSAEAAGGEVTDVERYEVVYSDTMGAQHSPGRLRFREPVVAREQAPWGGGAS